MGWGRPCLTCLQFTTYFKRVQLGGIIRQMRLSVPFFSIASYILIFVAISIVKPPPEDPLQVLASRSQSMLQAYATNDHTRNRSIVSEVDSSDILSLYKLDELFFEYNWKIYGHGRENLANSIIKKMMTGISTLLLSQDIAHPSLYNSTIASNSSRVNGLLLVYELTTKAVQMVLEPLNQTITANPDNKTLTETHEQLSQLFNNSFIAYRDRRTRMLFMPDNPKQQYWHHYHTNLTQQLGQSTHQQHLIEALKAINIVVRTLYGHKVPSDQLQPLLCFFKALSQASHRLYSYDPTVTLELEHLEGLEPYQYWMFLIGAVLVAWLVLRQVSLNKKIKKQFKHVFPQQMKKMRIQ